MNTHYQSLLVLSLSFFLLQNSFAQTDEKSIRDKVLYEITTENEKKTSELEKQISDLNRSIVEIDSLLQVPQNSQKQTIKKLRKRVEFLELKEEAEKKKELEIYKFNFQTAVINLVSMEKEIKPLELFAASQDFYAELNSTANPTKYSGFSVWYSKFKVYLNDTKKQDAFLNIATNILDKAGDFSKEFGITGTVSDILFSSVSMFIQSLGGKKKKKIREESEKMFRLIMTLSQFSTDKNLIENEWDEIEKQLTELKELQDTTLNKTLNFLGISKSDFTSYYINETNAIQSLNYLNQIKNVAGEKVAKRRKTKADIWKDEIFLEMNTVQSLKIRFGQTTTSIDSNIQRYKGLITKYKTDDNIGNKISGLESKLTRLDNAFDDNFRPQKYVSDAIRMYKIH
ncbi:hypothetical protein ABW636_19000 [Aquimarina sp. 2201CG1-2-11]|uniref:hypothetical protein n=1 Tax=Aquimarina discodermiae TaxID=3231043 RepID=UPI0034620AFB